MHGGLVDIANKTSFSNTTIVIENNSQMHHGKVIGFSTLDITCFEGVNTGISPILKSLKIWPPFRIENFRYLGTLMSGENSFHQVVHPFLSVKEVLHNFLIE
jgi:hypothetical protein